MKKTGSIKFLSYNAIHRYSASVQHPERHGFDLSTLCGLPVSRRYTATPGSSPLSMRLGIWSGWVGGKTTKKLRTARKSAACPSPLKRKKIKTRNERKVRMGLTLKKYPAPTDRRCHTHATATTPPLRHCHSPTFALAKPHNRIAGRGGDLGSHTSPQSS